MAFSARTKKIVIVSIVFLFFVLVIFSLYFLPKPFQKESPVINNNTEVTETPNSPFEDYNNNPVETNELTGNYTSNAFSLSGLTSLTTFNGDIEDWKSLLYSNQYLADLTCTQSSDCTLNFILFGADSIEPKIFTGIDINSMCPAGQNNILVDEYIYGHLDNVVIDSYLDKKIKVIFTIDGENIFVDGLPQPEWCVYYVE